MSENFIHNLRQPDQFHKDLIEQAKDNISERCTEEITPAEAIHLLSEEYARLMQAPAALFDAYVKTLVDGFFAELAATDPDDPMLAGHDGGGEGQS